MTCLSNTREFLEVTNSKYESVFQNATKLAQEMNSLDDSKRAAKRALSYNPANKCVMSLFPEYVDATKFICDLISKNSNIVNEKSDAFDSWVILGQCYLCFGDFPNAFAAFTRAQKLKDATYITNPYFWFSLGVVYSHFSYNRKAVECFQRVFKDKEFIPDIHFTAEINFRLAILHRSLELYDESITYFSKVLDNPPENLTADDINFQIAFTFQLFNDRTQAEMLYNEILLRHPTNLKIISQYAWFCVTCLKDIERALLMLQDALEIDRDDPTVLLLLARIMLKIDDTKSAHAYYRNCISYWGDTAPFWCSLGVLYYRNDQNQDAVIAFQRALYLSCDMVEAWLNLGTILEALEQPQNAKKIYTTGKQSCNDGTLLDERIRNLARNSDPEEYEILDISDEKYFIQIPLEFSNSYIMAVPKLPQACLGISDVTLNINDFASLPKSYFEI